MVSAYTTLAPPPATIVHTRPLRLSSVNFSDAPVRESRSWMNASSGHGWRPKGGGKSRLPHLGPAMNSAASSIFAATSNG